jgi:hypothetical protein
MRRFTRLFTGVSGKWGAEYGCDMTDLAVTGWRSRMGWVVRLIEMGIDNPARSVDVLEFGPRSSLSSGSARSWMSSRANAPLLRRDYLHSQSARLVKYVERYRAGLRVGTSATEGTANFLVNRRMSKSHQMRWSRQGADLLLQVRCAVYNGALCVGFGHLFEKAASSDLPPAKAA